MSGLSIQHLMSGGVVTNYNCVSRCGHCLYNCGHRRPRDYLDGDQAGRIFSRIADLGCRSVHIGGGEPLLRPEKLIEVLAAARQAGVGIDYIETSSGWFVDLDEAVALLERPRAEGLQTLLVSISPFHNAHIPFAKVRGVLDACLRSGVTALPWVNGFIEDLSRLDENTPHPMADFIDAFGPDYLSRIPDRYWIHLGGRALSTFRPVYRQYPLSDILARSPKTCAGALSDTSHFHIDLYGNYVPGLCAGLAIDMDDLGRPLPAGKYPALDQLASAGIRGLLDLARRDHGISPRRDVYLSHCDLCTDLRALLVRVAPDRFPELAPAGFYDEID